MKKYFVLCTSALMALIACDKGSKEVPATAGSEDAVPIELSAQLPAAVFATPTKSAIGALDSLHKDQKLYVYCVPRTGSASDAELDLEHILIDNVQATFPEGFGQAGTRTHEKQKVSIINTGTEPYYYSEDRRYEFFGYYVDDAASVNPTVGTESISLAVKVDGSQDILLAKTNKEEDNDGPDILPSRLYSAYSARHGVTPKLDFQHLLSRFNVYVRSGNERITNDITITSFAIRTKTDGTVYIAYKDHPETEDDQHPSLVVSEDVNNYTYLPIWNGTNGNATKRLSSALTGEEKYISGLQDGWPGKQNPLGTILVMPYETEYEMKIGYTQEGYSGGESVITYTINFEDLLPASKDPKLQNAGDTEAADVALDVRSQPGHQYDLNVVIYGLGEVEVTVTLQDWEESGSFVVDQDEDQAIAINIADLDTPTSDNYGKGKLETPIELSVNGTYTIVATTFPEGQTLSYSSSKESVATVSADGVITAVAAGDAKIVITAPATESRPEGGYRVIRVHVTE